MRKLWLDTDPGFDDWMTWAMLAHDPQFELLGVSIVAGNAPLCATLDNALRIRQRHGWQFPLHAGCDRPLVQRQETAQDVLGAAGLDTVGRVLPASNGRPSGLHGATALIDCVRAHPGEVTLVAIGPLTNLATAFAQAPDIAPKLREIVLMGGSTDRGNTTAVAEFNIFADPEAAAQVFAAGVPISMFGLNLCRQITVGADDVARVRSFGTPLAELFADHLAAYVGIALRRGRPRMALYDPVTALWLARPELFTLEPAHVAIELAGTHTRGMTVCEFRVPAKAQPNARVAMQVDATPALAHALAQLQVALK